MAIQIIKAGSYSNRSSLENAVRNKFGLTPELKADVEIHGTPDELARLQLSTRSIFWGIKCVDSTGEKTEDNPDKVPDKPDRGPVQAFGVNGRLKQRPKPRAKEKVKKPAKKKINKKKK